MNSKLYHFEFLLKFLEDSATRRVGWRGVVVLCLRSHKVTKDIAVTLEFGIYWWLEYSWFAGEGCKFAHRVVFGVSWASRVGSGLSVLGVIPLIVLHVPDGWFCFPPISDVNSGIIDRCDMFLSCRIKHDRSTARFHRAGQWVQKVNRWAFWLRDNRLYRWIRNSRVQWWAHSSNWWESLHCVVLLCSWLWQGVIMVEIKCSLPLPDWRGWFYGLDIFCS